MHAGTSYGVVHGSDWSLKDTPSLEIIQRRIPQLF